MKDLQQCLLYAIVDLGYVEPARAADVTHQLVQGGADIIQLRAKGMARKEIAALATELRKVGAEVEEFADGLKITPRPLHGAVIDTYNDHRMAMSMALIGLKVPGIVIRNPGCVAKTYPDFFTDLEALR